MSVDIEAAVYSLLKKDETLASLLYGQLIGGASAVGYRIYPDLMAQGTLLPALAFFEVSDVLQSTTEGPALQTARIQVDAYATTKDVATSLRIAVDNALCPRQRIGQEHMRRTVVLDAGESILVHGIFPHVGHAGYENQTKLYRRGRDYMVTASAA